MRALTVILVARQQAVPYRLLNPQLIYGGMYYRRIYYSKKNLGSLGITVKAPNILCHQCGKAS